MPYVVDHARGTLIPPFDGTLRVDGPGPPLPSRRLDSTVGDCQGIERVLPRALSAVRRAFRYVRGYAHIVAVERGYRGRRLCRGRDGQSEHRRRQDGSGLARHRPSPFDVLLAIYDASVTSK